MRKAFNNKENPLW